MVVFPHPGGPQSTIDASLRPSTMRPIGASASR
jgi:hypothetical protein